MSIYQDWEPVVLRKPAKIIYTNNSKQKEEVDDGDMPKKINTYNKELSIAMQNARTAKNYKQSDLAKKLNIQTSIINDIECGKAIYNRQTYSKIMRFLGVDIKSLNLPKT